MLSAKATPESVVEKLNLLRLELKAYFQEQLPLLFPEIHDEVSYMVAGGKFLRGALSLFSADVAGCDKTRALPIALAVELMHASSLVYDDISDSTESRRGQPSFWKKYGLDEAVIVPHAAMATAISLIARYGGPEAVIASMGAWREAAVGQLWDLRAAKKNMRVVASYREVVSKKTGEVFGAACTLPLYAAGKRNLADIFKNYGVTLGAAYQVIDDMSDLSRGVKDSGSALLLLEESQGDYLQYGSRVLHQLITELLQLSGRLPAECGLLAAEILRTFAEEAGGEVREHVFRILGGFAGSPRAPY
ncbi:MAG: polyprenyl synthetase family protein [Thermofilum sp.]